MITKRALEGITNPFFGMGPLLGIPIEDVVKKLLEEYRDKFLASRQE